MTLKRLFEDDDAVSPVIGVILMVAITVILAAVIGTFVLGLGDQVSETSPTASVTFTQDGAANEAEITITHDSGQSLSADNIKVLVNGAEPSEDIAGQWADGDSITAGESIKIHNDDVGASSGDANVADADGGLATGATVSVVWTSDDGSQSDTLQEYTVS